MKHMIQWAFTTDTYERGVKQFLETGGPDPEGVRTIGRWHAPGTMYGFHLVEADPADVTKLTSQWASLVDLTITPVIDDDEAKKGLSATFQLERINLCGVLDAYNSTEASQNLYGSLL